MFVSPSSLSLDTAGENTPVFLSGNSLYLSGEGEDSLPVSLDGVIDERLALCSEGFIL